MARRLTIAAVTLLLAAPASAQAASPLAGTSWTAKRVGGHVLPPGSRAQLTFKAHRFAGRIDCNRIGGRYRGYRLTNGRLLLLGRRGRTLARLVPRR